MSVSQALQTEQEDLTPTEEAFKSASSPKELPGSIELEPFNLLRRTLALRMGVFGPLQEALPADLKDWRPDQLAALFHNAVTCVWACTLSPAEVSKARRDPNAEARAYEWAEAQGYDDAHFQPLLALYARINREGAPSKGIQDGSNAESEP